MAGAGKDREILLKSIRENALIRAPWLLATFVGGVMSMLIVGFFSKELMQVIALASFMPIITGMGGNIATQSSTIIVRGIATGRVNINELFRIVFKEMRVGLILGICYGILLGVMTYLGFAEPKTLGLVVGISIFFSMVMAATVGALIPLVLKRFDVDAAVATGPVVTTSIDFLGVLMYLSVAKILLNL